MVRKYLSSLSRHISTTPMKQCRGALAARLYPLEKKTLFYPQPRNTYRLNLILSNEQATFIQHSKTCWAQSQQVIKFKYEKVNRNKARTHPRQFAQPHAGLQGQAGRNFSTDSSEAPAVCRMTASQMRGWWLAFPRLIPCFQCLTGSTSRLLRLQGPSSQAANAPK